MYLEFCTLYCFTVFLHIFTGLQLLGLSGKRASLGSAHLPLQEQTLSQRCCGVMYASLVVPKWLSCSPIRRAALRQPRGGQLPPRQPSWLRLRTLRPRESSRSESKPVGQEVHVRIIVCWFVWWLELIDFLLFFAFNFLFRQLYISNV